MSIFSKRADASERYPESLPVSDPNLFSKIFGLGGLGRTDAGIQVSMRSSMTLSAVYCAVGIISDNIAMFPVDIFQKKDGKSTQIDHDLSQVLNLTPNPYMSSFTLRSVSMQHTLLWGNGYQEIQRNGHGDVIALWPLMPDATQPHKPDAQTDLSYKTMINGKSFDLAKEDVLHIPALGYDGYCGYSPINLMRNGIGLALATEAYGAKFFSNDAKSGGFLQHPGKLSETAVDNISKAMNSKNGLDNAHRIRVLEEGMKFVSTSIPPDDAQFLATRQFQVAEIARIYRVPLVLMNSMEKTSSWGSGIEQLLINFVTMTLQPWITRVEQEMMIKLLSDEDRQNGIYIKLNVNALLRGDMAARAEFYKAGIQDGWLVRNEAREKEDMNPLPGLDKPLVPANMVQIGDNSDNTGVKNAK